MSLFMTSLTLIGVVLAISSPVSSKFPDLNEIKVLLHVYFPSLNENTTIYSFLSDEKNVALLERVHEHSCIDLKRKRKVRSLDWLWNKFTLPIDGAVANGSLTITTPAVYTLNDTEEERYSIEGKFYNPYSPNDNVTIIDDASLNDTTTKSSGPTKWPTNAYGDRVPKKNMKAMDYINMVNNDVDAVKDEVGAGGCPLGFGRG